MSTSKGAFTKKFRVGAQKKVLEVVVFEQYEAPNGVWYVCLPVSEASIIESKEKADVKLFEFNVRLLFEKHEEKRIIKPCATL